MTKLKTVFGILLAGFAMLWGTAASAVQSYGNLAAPGVYFGAGNINGNFTIDTANGIELGLRAKDRESGATLDGSTGTYFANPGLYNGVGPKKKWNYEFSANTGNVALQNFTFKLGVDHDPTAGTAYSWVDPSSYWPDNALAVGSNGSRTPRTRASSPHPVDHSAANLVCTPLTSRHGAAMGKPCSLRPP